MKIGVSSYSFANFIKQNNADCTEKAISQKEFHAISEYIDTFKPNKKHEIYHALP